MRNDSEQLKKLVFMGLLAAVSVVLVTFTRVPFFLAPFLEYDAADVPIFIGTFAFGPLSGLLLTVVVSFIQAFGMGGNSIYGFIMHVTATGCFVIVSGNVYKLRKTKKGAMVALALGTVSMAAMMLFMNVLITPLFMDAPRADVIAMLVPIFIPFNLLKGGVNSLLTLLIYKHVSKYIHKHM